MAKPGNEPVQAAPSAVGGDGVDRVAAWVLAKGLAGMGELALLQGFCARCREAGIDVARGLAIIDTLHPIWEGRAFHWRADGSEEKSVIEFGPTNQGDEAEDNWRRSAFFHVLQTGGSEFRRRLGGGDPPGFHQLEQLAREGQTDYFIMVHRFASDGVIGEMDCVYTQWTTERPAGFADDELAALRRLVPSLALAIKCASLARIASTLVEVYLGHDAGRRVLGGRMRRGVAEQINAVLWFSDLRGFTTITDNAAPDEIIPLLNDYAEAVIVSVREAGGDVLKLIGDGTLAIFPAGDAEAACAAALRAEAALRARVAVLNRRRKTEGRPVTQVYIGLHIGDVFYGNIGSTDRLDFTVIGPAVNEASRIAAMCRSADRHVLMSTEFVAATPAGQRAQLVSVGRFALRGVGRAQELFTLDPALLTAPVAP